MDPLSNMLSQEKNILEQRNRKMSFWMTFLLKFFLPQKLTELNRRCSNIKVYENSLEFSENTAFYLKFSLRGCHNSDAKSSRKSTNCNRSNKCFCRIGFTVSKEFLVLFCSFFKKPFQRSMKICFWSNSVGLLIKQVECVYTPVFVSGIFKKFWQQFHVSVKVHALNNHLFWKIFIIALRKWLVQKCCSYRTYG